MPQGAGRGSKGLRGSPPPAGVGFGKRKRGKGAETGTHRPWSPSPRSDSPSPPPPPRPRCRYRSPWRRPREAGEGSDPEVEHLPFCWAIAPRVPPPTPPPLPPAAPPPRPSPAGGRVDLNLERRYSARNVERGAAIRIYYAASTRLAGSRTAARRDWPVARQPRAWLACDSAETGS